MSREKMPVRVLGFASPVGVLPPCILQRPFVRMPGCSQGRPLRVFAPQGRASENGMMILLTGRPPMASAAVAQLTVCSGRQRPRAACRSSRARSSRRRRPVRASGTATYRASCTRPATLSPVPLPPRQPPGRSHRGRPGRAPHSGTGHGSPRAGKGLLQAVGTGALDRGIQLLGEAGHAPPQTAPSVRVSTAPSDWPRCQRRIAG